MGGAEVAVREKTNRLIDFDFDMITARFDKKLPKISEKTSTNNIKIYRVGFGNKFDKYLFPFLGYLKAKELHKEKKYDTVLAIMAFYAGLATIFFKYRFPKVKYVLNMQSGDSDLFIWLRTWFWHPLYKKIYTKPDYIYAISNFLIKRAKKFGYKRKIDLIPNGVDIKRFTNHDSEIKNSELRKNLKIKNDEKILITTSRLVPKNGIKDLIDAAKILVNKNHKIKLLVLGSGPLEKKLKIKIKNLKLQNEVLLLGNIEQKEIPKYLDISDIFIRPSLSEGMGISFLEAMATGLPIIATPVGGIPDFLEHKKTGMRCEVKNPKSIAKQIETLLKNPELKDIIVKNAKELVYKKYNWDNIVPKIEKIL